MKRHVSIRRLKKLGRKKCSVLHLDIGRAAKETWIASFPLHGLIAAPRPFPVAPIYSTVSHSRVSLQNGHLVAITLSLLLSRLLLLLLLYLLLPPPPYLIVDEACPATMETRSSNC